MRIILDKSIKPAIHSARDLMKNFPRWPSLFEVLTPRDAPARREILWVADKCHSWGQSGPPRPVNTVGGALNHKAWVKFFIDRITLFKVLENADEFFLVTETMREMPHQVPRMELHPID